MLREDLILLKKVSCFLILFAIMMLCVNQRALGSSLGRTINVPLDYKRPQFGLASLYFELGAPYDTTKPVVLLIADAQQFYIRRGPVAELQQKLLGDDFNVIGIIGRGACEECINAALDRSGHPDWMKAWQIFNSEQWIEDIDTVRRNVVGQKGKIFLYGASGGAYLIHQYMMKYGDYVRRAFTASAVNPFISSNLGLRFDTFWGQLESYDRNLQVMLKKILEDHKNERIKILMTLQRQHFFVSAEKLAEARANLIRGLANGDAVQYEHAKKEYQVEDILNLFNSSAGIPILVREFELIYPSGAFRNLGGEQIYPFIESQYFFLKPLVSMVEVGKLPAPALDFAAAHHLSTEVFILAARSDEAVDYRTSIALAFAYPHHLLFIAEDNHTFEKLKENGVYTTLLRTFIGHGLGSKELQSALNACEHLRWTEL